MAQTSNVSSYLEELVRSQKQTNQELRRSQMNSKSEMSRAIADAGLNVLKEALSPVLRVVNTISKLLSMIVMPFTNVIIPLLLPILYFLLPIVKFANMIMRPVYVEMMKRFKTEMAGHDVSSVMDIGTLIGMIGKVMEPLVEFVGIMLAKLTTIIANAFPKSLGEVVDFIKKSLTGIIFDVQGELLPHISLLFTVVKNFVVVALASVGKFVINTLADIFKWIAELVGPHLANIINAVNGVIVEIEIAMMRAWNSGISPVLNSIIEGIQIAYNQLVDIVNSLIDGFIGLAKHLIGAADAVSGFANLINKIIPKEFKTKTDTGFLDAMGENKLSKIGVGGGLKAMTDIPYNPTSLDPEEFTSDITKGIDSMRDTSVQRLDEIITEAEEENAEALKMYALQTKNQELLASIDKFMEQLTKKSWSVNVTANIPSPPESDTPISSGSGGYGSQTASR